MSHPHTNELGRSGHSSPVEHARTTRANARHPGESGPAGPVPARNQPGHRPEVDQDKPTEAFAAFFTAADPENRHDPATVATRLRLGSGFASAERPDILERLSSLDHALAAFAADVVELELSTKDRDRPGQATTLQCWVAGWPRLVATSSQPSFVSSLVEVRDDLRRQLDDAKARSTPRHDRSVRNSGSPS